VEHPGGHIEFQIEIFFTFDRVRRVRPEYRSNCQFNAYDRIERQRNLWAGVM
jgi:hypothetical protein